MLFRTGRPTSKWRVALLGGATTDALKRFLHLFLLRERIEPTFYESEYNRYYEDAVVDNAALSAFAPQIGSGSYLVAQPDWDAGAH